MRKGVSPAFNAVRMRNACDIVVQCAGKLADIITVAGPGAQQNVDKLLLRESMDVLGKADSDVDSTHT